MPLLKARPWYASANSQRLTSICFIVIAAIATIDAFVVPMIGLGFLYFVPLVIAGAFLSTWQVLLLAVICTAFWDGFSNLPYTEAWLLRDSFVFFSYSFVTLMIRDMIIYRRAALCRIDELEMEFALLARSAENSDLAFNSSPVAMLTVSSEGKIISSNRAAHRIFSVEPGALTGQAIREFLPEFEGARHPQDGTAGTEIAGRRADGSEFRARVWSSSFHRDAEESTTVIVVDLSAACSKVGDSTN